MQQRRDHRIARLMPHARQLFGQLSHALAGPAQPGLRIAARDRFDQFFQVLHQCRTLRISTLASASQAPEAPRRVRGGIAPVPAVPDGISRWLSIPRRCRRRTSANLSMPSRTTQNIDGWKVYFSTVPIPDIDALVLQRGQLKERISQVGEMRPGSLVARLRRCGKPTCHCAKKRREGTWAFVFADPSRGWPDTHADYSRWTCGGPNQAAGGGVSPVPRTGPATAPCF